MPIASEQDGSLSELARGKLARVLGAERGERLYCETLRALAAEQIDSPDLLYAFGQQLVKRGGIEAAVGAMLGVAAVVRGASVKANGSEEDV